jgi:hypothetical protein
MIHGGKTFVVRSWPGSQTTAGGGYVEDNHGNVWRRLESWESCNSAANTTGCLCAKLLPNGEIKP